MLDVDKIGQLIEMMVANDLVEISLRDGDVEVNLRRPTINSNTTAMATDGTVLTTTAQAPVPAQPVAPAAPEAAVGEPDDSDLVEIAAPMVGTFYSASDPESAPFATVGTEVHPGSVVCILEAMKVFNEIKAEIAGRIERILVKNAQAVEYAQPLFLIRPL